MGVAASDTVVVVIEIQISGNEPRSDSKRAQSRNHEHREVATTPAAQRQGPYRILGSLLVPRHVLEVPLDSLRHVDEKLAGIGRSILAEELGGPAIELGIGGQRRDEAREVGLLFGGVGKRIAAGKIIDIDCVEVPRRVGEMNCAFEAKFRGAVRETGPSLLSDYRVPELNSTRNEARA
jgi:hypothetical protein